MNAKLSKDPDHGTWNGGTVVYRITVNGTWIGWVGDGRNWRGWRYGGRRWWACWRQDGDAHARWCSDLDYLTRAVALDALLVIADAHNLT